MKGKYTVRENGLVVAEVDNLLTNNARIAILNYLSGNIGNWASAVAVGALEDAPAVTDTTLAFEIGRGPITVRAADLANNAVLMKATIPARVEGEIHELGVFSSVNMTGRETNQLLLTDFNMEALDDTALNAYPMRIGGAGSEIVVPASSTLTVNYPELSMDISALSVLNEMLLACYATGVTNVEFKMVNSTGNYISHSFVPPADYGTERWLISDFATVGSGTYEEAFTELEVVVTAGAGGGTLYLDGLRVDEVDSPADQMLVSRAVLDTPIEKSTSSEMEIEYSVEMGF